MDEERARGGGPAGPPGDDDEQLFARLREVAARVDPVPADALLAARSALAYRNLDAELAELVHDSAVAPTTAAVRSDAEPARQLTFSAGVVEVELEIVVEGERRRLVGQCLPAAELEVTLRQAELASTVTTDDLGRFALDAEPGLVSLQCRWPHGPAVETSWVLI